MTTIYQEIILYHYKHPHNFGEIVNPDKKASVINTICGDKVIMTLKLSGQVVSDIKFSGHGCAISVASASMLTDFVKGKSTIQLQKITQSDIMKLLEIKLTPSRLKCALLPMEALKKAINS